jgi:hypothetical protein
MIMEWYEILISIASGLIALIPLVIKLVEYVEKAAKEKNWTSLLKLVTRLVEEAEGKFDNGEERKQWVLMAVKASADTLNYDINMDQVSELIDSLCELSKKVNVGVKPEEKVEEVTE